MKFIKLFNEQTEFDAAKGTLYNPNVSYIKGNGGVYSLGYTYVDLGLTSGTLWAKCNVGAEKETDYGFYFQWGDIKNKSNAECSWTTYKYCNGSLNSMNKYCTDNSYGPVVDNKTTLESADDAATQIMGDEWRMPTKADFQELVNNTTIKWFDDFNGSGVKGCTFTSTKDTSKYIFIPASGVRRKDGFTAQNSIAFVWSSSLVVDYSINAYYLSFASNTPSPNDYGDNVRSVGLTVRGVTKRQDA